MRPSEELEMTALPGRPQTRHGRLAGLVVLAALPVAGCACSEAGWESYAYREAAAAESEDECAVESLSRRSKSSAEIAESADPRLLDEARREAKRACMRGKDRHRLPDGWQPTLK
jgi:hypothetical protein